MPNPAFLVEGQMEQAIVQRICPGSAVRLIGCNGKDVSMTVLSKALNARLQRLSRYDPVIIILDREQRTEECNILLNDLSLKLDDLGFSGRYILAMPDRTTEVWTLSDWDEVRRRMPEMKEYHDIAEGRNGKAIIKKLLPDDVVYHETTIGVEMFMSIRPNVVYMKSDSFREFMDKISLPCHWASSISSRFQPSYMSDI